MFCRILLLLSGWCSITLRTFSPGFMPFCEQMILQLLKIDHAIPTCVALFKLFSQFFHECLVLTVLLNPVRRIFSNVRFVKGALIRITGRATRHSSFHSHSRNVQWRVVHARHVATVLRWEQLRPRISTTRYAQLVHRLIFNYNQKRSRGFGVLGVTNEN